MPLVDPRLCACGSGLRRTRCCQLDEALLAPRDATRHLTPLIEQAQLALQENRLGAAESLCLEILELSPGQQEILTALYQICKTQRRHKASEALIRRIVSLNPNHLWATQELALRLMNNGNLGEAEIHARNTVRIAPDNPQSHNLMGMILTEANRPRIGEYHYRRVLELLEQPDAIVLANLAWNLKNQGRISEARALYEQSVALAPNVLQTLLGWARLEEADRRFAACATLLDQAEALAPGHQSVLLTRAVLYGRMREPGKALAVLDQMAGSSEGTAECSLGPSELLEKGRLLDQMHCYQEAFPAFVEAKRLSREASGKTYMDEHAKALANRLRGFFIGGRLATLPRATLARNSPQPIFIVGFPRSGTTLIEQTLTAHTRISAGDELPFIAEIADSMSRLLNSPLNYPEALCELWFGDRRHELDNLRDYYLQRVRHLSIMEPGAVWFTDKMPLNETHLGLIGLLFPHSPVIHLLRHPLDVVLSVFSNQLTHGFFCASELQSVAQHYALIMDLVAHYRSEMLLRYLPVRYEDVVADQEGSIRRMLDFIGEKFEADCLNFHENRRYARTASYAQVTEKLYDRSRYRYRNYLKQLAPVIPILTPAMERLGYEVTA